MLRTVTMLGMTAVVVLGVATLTVGPSLGLQLGGKDQGGGADGPVPSGRGQDQPSPVPEPITGPGTTTPGTAPRPAARNPIVIRDCRLVPLETQEVPSQREGSLLLVGRELLPGEPVPP